MGSERALIRRKGPRTKEDDFWKWLHANESGYFYLESEPADKLAELIRKIKDVDPGLMAELGPKIEGSQVRDLFSIANKTKVSPGPGIKPRK